MLTNREVAHPFITGYTLGLTLWETAIATLAHCLHFTFQWQLVLIIYTTGYLTAVLAITHYTKQLPKDQP